MAQNDAITGKPEETMGMSPGAIVEPLQQEADTATSSWGQLLSQFVIALIEQPEQRLAGAEETVRQMIATTEQILGHYESLSKELASRATEAYGQIHNLLGTVKAAPIGNRKTPAMIVNLVELVRVYPKWRLQSLFVQRVTNVFVSVRGQLSDDLRELNFCRARLGKLQEHFQSEDTDELFEEELASARTLFPGNSRSLKDATERLLDTASPAEIEKLDHQMQSVITQHRSEER